LKQLYANLKLYEYAVSYDNHAVFEIKSKQVYLQKIKNIAVT